MPGRPERAPDAPAPAVALPTFEIRPPAFLGPREAMADVYTRSRSRTTQRTAALLASDELDMLLSILGRVASLPPRPEARLSKALLEAVGREIGPLLTGFDDPRLTEPWRLFLEGWDLATLAEGEARGVELYCEGEFENDAGDTIEMLASLALVGGELRLSTRVGAVQDELWSDGSTCYRLQRGRR